MILEVASVAFLQIVFISWGKMNEADVEDCTETATAISCNGLLHSITKQATLRTTLGQLTNRATLALARGFLRDQNSKRG